MTSPLALLHQSYCVNSYCPCCLHSKKLRRLRMTEFVESCHFQNVLSLTGYTVCFASNLQSRHPSSYPLLWPSSSPATKTMNAATSNAAKTHAPINNFFILNPFFRTCARFATRKNHRPSSRRTSSPVVSSPPSRAAASASPPTFLSSQVPWHHLSRHSLCQYCCVNGVGSRNIRYRFFREPPTKSISFLPKAIPSCKRSMSANLANRGHAIQVLC